MQHFIETSKLTHMSAIELALIAVNRSKEIDVAEIVAIVDDGCNLLAFVRMDGSRLLSIKSVQRKAMTAVNLSSATGYLEKGLALSLASASDGMVVNLKGGLPIYINGHLVGGIGIGSASGDIDEQIATYALNVWYSRFGIKK